MRRDHEKNIDQFYSFGETWINNLKKILNQIPRVKIN
jgi:hypothetical protein